MSEVMNKARVESFSDAVIAVAITLLILDIPVPPIEASGSLAHALAQQWPRYAAYVVSFVTIGIIWINHHAMLRRMTGVVVCSGQAPLASFTSLSVLNASQPSQYQPSNLSLRM